jgi:hypothetical protein
MITSALMSCVLDISQKNITPTPSHLHFACLFFIKIQIDAITIPSHLHLKNSNLAKTFCSPCPAINDKHQNIILHHFISLSSSQISCGISSLSYINPQAWPGHRFCAQQVHPLTST